MYCMKTKLTSPELDHQRSKYWNVIAKFNLSTTLLQSQKWISCAKENSYQQLKLSAGCGKIQRHKSAAGMWGMWRISLFTWDLVAHGFINTLWFIKSGTCFCWIVWICLAVRCTSVKSLFFVFVRWQWYIKVSSVKF